MIYASEQTAVSRFFSHNECGYCVTRQNLADIVNGINFFIENDEYRKKISQNVINVALGKFDAKKVRSKFQKLIFNHATNYSSTDSD